MDKLPPELLNDIVGYLPTQSQLNACRTSRLFDSISTWWIYRHVTLQNWPATLGCFKTLSTNVTTASLVQSITVRFKCSSSDTSLLAPTYRMFEKAFYNIAPHIIHFSLLDINIKVFPLTTDCPLLRALSISLPVTPQVIAFIARHPKLEHLVLSGSAPEALPRQVHLPRLTSLTCPSDLIPSLALGSPLSHLEVTWDQVQVSPLLEPEVVFETLANSITPITSFNCYGWKWVEDICPYVSKTFGQLERLSLWNRRPSHSAKEAFFTGVSLILPELKHLHMIEILWYPADKVNLGCLDLEFNKVTVWGSLCPSLEICTLPSVIIWSRIKANDSLWFPAGDKPACNFWWVQKLRSGMYPEVNKAVKELAHRLGEGGVFTIEDFLRSTYREAPHYGLRSP